MTNPEKRDVGGYALRERVGVSLSGDTFRAFGGALKQEVAVKVLSAPLAGNRELIRSLEAKGSEVARLDHPNVAPLVDYGSDNGSYFVVTGFVHGRSLDRIIREDGPLSVIQAVGTVAEVAAALHAGHSIGLVHGSLRPSKVIQTSWGEPRLSGFGLVPVQGPDGGGLRSEYAVFYPPEKRDAATPDVASDIYALGVVLFELLAGEPPAPSAGRAVPAPSQQNPEVSPELDAIVAKALAPDPKERFRDAFEFEVALRTYHRDHLERLVWQGNTATQDLLEPQGAGPSPPSSPVANAPRPTAKSVGADPAAGEETTGEAKTGAERTGTVADAPDRGARKGAEESSQEALLSLISSPEPHDRVIDLDRDDLDEGDHAEGAARVILEPKKRLIPSMDRAPRVANRTRHTVGWAAGIVALIFVAAVADFVYAGLAVVSSLREASRVVNGISQLQNGAYTESARTFSEANEASERALEAMGHPSYRLASVIPWVKADPQALRSLAEGSRLAASAGVTATDAVVAMGAPKDGPAAAIYRNGRVQFNALEKGAPFLGRVHGLLDEAALTMAAAPEANLGAVRDAVSEATMKIEGARDTAAKVETLTNALPSLLGRDVARRYLLAFQSPSRSRGSGGVIALYGILEAADGHIEFDNARSIDFLGDVSADEATAPDWFVEEYSKFGAFEDFDQAGFSPSFSVVAPLFADLYESAIGVPVDGVLGMDPGALGRLTKVTGPIEQPGYGVQLNAENTVQVLNHDVYLHFGKSDDERDAYTGSVIEEFWRRIGSPEARVSALATGLANVVSSQHFKIYSRLVDDQRALADLEANGDYRPYGSAVQTVFHNNLAKNKIDYFLERSVETSIQLHAGEDASVTTNVVMVNNAVAGPSSDFLGPGDDPSVNHTRLSLLLPQDARVQSYSRNGKEVTYETGAEGVYPLASENLEIPAGGRVGTTANYSMPTPSFEGEENGTFRFTMFPQATVNPDRLSLRVEPPEGYSILTPDGPGILKADGSFRYRARASAPLTVELQIERD